MSLDWKFLEDYRKRSRRSGFWKGVILSSFLIGAIFFAIEFMPPLQKGPHISRVHLDGVLFDDPIRLQALSKLTEDDDVKSVLLKINSPGGTVVGSEALYLAVAEMAASKPVIALLGETAASGGFLVALAADHILARNNTLTGSIGVIVENQNFFQLSEKLGISLETVKSGELKGGQNPIAPPNEAVKINNEALVRFSFDWFLSLVRKERNVSAQVIEKIKDGRTLTGGMALELGLIDQIGSEKEALEFLEGVDLDFKELPIFDAPEFLKSTSGLSRFFPYFKNLSVDSLITSSNNVKLMSILR